MARNLAVVRPGQTSGSEIERREGRPRRREGQPSWHEERTVKLQEPATAGDTRPHRRAADQGRGENRVRAAVVTQNRGALPVDAGLGNRTGYGDGTRGSQNHRGERIRIDSKVEERAASGIRAPQPAVRGYELAVVCCEAGDLAERSRIEQLPEDVCLWQVPRPHGLHRENAAFACRGG